MMNVDWGHGIASLAEAKDRRDALAADPLFPHREACLNTKSARRLLGAAFPELDMSSGIEPINVWYIPRTSLQVVYRVARPDVSLQTGETVLRVRFYPPGESEGRAAAGQAAASDPRRVRHLPAWSAVAWMFPEDADLPALRLLADDGYGGRSLGPGGRWNVLSYLPGRRCAVRYRWPGDPVGVVLHMQWPEEAARSHRLARAVWKAPSRRFRMPRPLGHDAGAGAFWEAFVPGQRLDPLLGTSCLEKVVARVMAALVEFHALQMPGLPASDADEVLHQTTARIVPKARVALPHLRDELDAFSRRLTARAGRLAAAEPVTLHGDLHTANLLLDDGDAVFIDFGRMSRGNPANDLALLGTRLLLIALHRPGGAQRGRAGTAHRPGGALRRRAALQEAARIVTALPRLYREAGGPAIPEDTFAWYVAALLVGRQIKTAIRHLAPGAGRVAPTLLAWANRTLEQGRFDESVLSHELDRGAAAPPDPPTPLLAGTPRPRSAPAGRAANGEQNSRNAPHNGLDEVSDVFEIA